MYRQGHALLCHLWITNLCLESHPRGQPHVNGIPHRKQKEIKDCTAPCWLECKRKLLATFTFWEAEHETPLSFPSWGYPGGTLLPDLQKTCEWWDSSLKIPLSNLLHWLWSLSFSCLEQSVKQPHLRKPFCICIFTTVLSLGSILTLSPASEEKRQKLQLLVLLLQPSTSLCWSPGCSILPAGPAHPLQPLPSTPALTCQEGCSGKHCLCITKWRHLNTQRVYPSGNFWQSLKCCWQLPAVNFGLFYLPVCIPTIENSFNTRRTGVRGSLLCCSQWRELFQASTTHTWLQQLSVEFQVLLLFSSYS